MATRPERLLSLRRMVPEDLDAVVSVERRAHVAPWSPELLRRELDHAWATVLVCEVPGADGALRVMGHIVFWLVHDEVHILNVATAPELRRMGAGTLLVTAAEQVGRDKGAVMSTLEVRRSNEAALALYRKLGYRQVGVRPRYYADNGEDAFVMTKELPAR